MNLALTEQGDSWAKQPVCPQALLRAVLCSLRSLALPQGECLASNPGA